MRNAAVVSISRLDRLQLIPQQARENRKLLALLAQASLEFSVRFLAPLQRFSSIASWKGAGPPVLRCRYFVYLVSRLLSYGPFRLAVLFPLAAHFRGRPAEAAGCGEIILPFEAPSGSCDAVWVSGLRIPAAVPKQRTVR